jgi:hypothetical protein
MINDLSHCYTFRDVLHINVPSDICHNPITIILTVTFYDIWWPCNIHPLDMCNKGVVLGWLFGGRVSLFVCFNHCYPLANGSLMQGWMKDSVTSNWEELCLYIIYVETIYSAGYLEVGTWVENLVQKFLITTKKVPRARKRGPIHPHPQKS